MFNCEVLEHFSQLRHLIIIMDVIITIIIILWWQCLCYIYLWVDNYQGGGMSGEKYSRCLCHEDHAQVTHTTAIRCE